MGSGRPRVRKGGKTKWRKKGPPKKKKRRVGRTPRGGGRVGGRGCFLDDLGDLARLQAAGADAEPLGGPAHHGPYRDQVGQPAPFAHVVGMADPVAEGRTFPAEITALRHRGSLEGDVGLLQPSTLYSISR